MTSKGDLGRVQTTSVHGGEREGYALGALTAPIVHATTFVIPSTAALKRHALGEEQILDYSRYSNPTVQAAEAKVAALEGAEAAMVTASGMAALSTLFLSMLRPGQHVVLFSDYYRPTGELIRGVLGKFGVTSSIVAFGDYDALEAECVAKQPKMIFSEVPSNPHVRVLDLPRVAALKRSVRGVKIVIDGTLAGPFNFRPLDHGADLVVYSLSKYHAGHNDVMAGAVVGKSSVIDALRASRALLGGILDPQSAYLLIRGMKTYALRMRAHKANAEAVAFFLDDHEAVERVWYPSVPSHPEHELAGRLMDGYGGVVSFVVHGGLEVAGRVVEGLTHITHAASLGGVESLIHQPAVFSYSDTSDAEREALGIEGGLLRLSVGVESTADLLGDLGEALGRAQ